MEHFVSTAFVQARNACLSTDPVCVPLKIMGADGCQRVLSDFISGMLICVCVSVRELVTD